jgi:4-hydroxy-tetrahydrodipicolinate reductase
MNRTRIGVLGSSGKVGQAVCDVLKHASEFELVVGLRRGDQLETLVEAGVQVVVDFTHPDAVMGNLEFAIAHGIHVVVGTTGFDAERLEQVRRWLLERPSVGVLVAPNFAVGALLLMKLAAVAAPFFDSVELIELHHASKADAPSGTARRTAELIARARWEAGVGASPDGTTHALEGARGSEVAGLRVHSLRLAGVLAREEILFGRPGEVLSIRHESTDRLSFVSGVMLAAKNVLVSPGLTVGIESLLGL